MSQQALTDLLSQGGRSLGPSLQAPEIKPEIPWPLHPILMEKNGFYAFGPALFVRPWGAELPGNCLWWNAKDTWRYEYGGVGDDLLFFAEDVFGFQFAVKPDGGFYHFDAESAELEFMGKDAYQWAAKVMGDMEFYTGAPLADAWTAANGQLPVGSRLAPAVPFAFGGSFEVDQLGAIPDVELMRFRGDLYQQTKDLPDGATIEFEA